MSCGHRALDCPLLQLTCDRCRSERLSVWKRRKVVVRGWGGAGRGGAGRGGAGRGGAGRGGVGWGGAGRGGVGWGGVGWGGVSGCLAGRGACAVPIMDHRAAAAGQRLQQHGGQFMCQSQLLLIPLSQLAHRRHSVPAFQIHLLRLRFKRVSKPKFPFLLQIGPHLLPAEAALYQVSFVTKRGTSFFRRHVIPKGLQRRPSPENCFMA